MKGRKTRSWTPSQGFFAAQSSVTELELQELHAAASSSRAMNSGTDTDGGGGSDGGGGGILSMCTSGRSIQAARAEAASRVRVLSLHEGEVVDSNCILSMFKSGLFATDADSWLVLDAFREMEKSLPPSFYLSLYLSPSPPYLSSYAKLC